MQSRRILVPLALSALALGACRSETPAATEGAADSAEATTPTPDASGPLTVQLASVGGSSVAGEATFTPEGAGVRVTARVTGLTPGEHGIHVHAGTSCDPADLPEDPDTDPNPAGAAGPHFAGADSLHGAPDAEHHHDGDFGNLTAGADGVATLDLVSTRLMLSGPNSILGHALVVHENRDDLTTQPSGASGARLACGLITAGGGTGATMPTGTPAAAGDSAAAM